MPLQAVATANRKVWVPHGGVPTSSPSLPKTGGTDQRCTGLLEKGPLNRPLGTTEVILHQEAGADSDPSASSLWDLQKTMWDVTNITSLAGCHRWRAPGSGCATVQWGAGAGARIGSLQNSHSVWSSPLASAQICSQRSRELSTGLNNWLSIEEHSCLFLTLTVRHKKEDSLTSVWDCVSKAWGRVTSGKGWCDPINGAKSRYSIEHIGRSVECTFSPANGWHLHSHAVLFLGRELNGLEMEGLKQYLFSKWKAGCEAQGFYGTSLARGIDLQRVDKKHAGQMAGYLTKGMLSGLGAEVGSGGLKRAKGQNMTPFQILEAIGQGRRELIPVWHSWERESLGRRQLLWSRGAKNALQVHTLTPQELEEREARRFTHTLAQIAPEEWTGHQSDIVLRKALSAVEADDLATAKEVIYSILDACQVYYSPCCIEIEGVEHLPGPTLQDWERALLLGDGAEDQELVQLGLF